MTAENPTTAQGTERRSFFRIDDTVRLSLRRVPAEELAGRLDRLDHGLAGIFTVMSSLSAITAQMTVGLRRIEKRDPELATYLRAVDQKIEVIGRALIAQEPELSAEDAVPVNLSAAYAGADDDCEYVVVTFSGTKMRFGQCKAVGIVLNDNAVSHRFTESPAKCVFEVGGQIDMPFIGGVETRFVPACDV